MAYYGSVCIKTTKIDSVVEKKTIRTVLNML